MIALLNIMLFNYHAIIEVALRMMQIKGTSTVILLIFHDSLYDFHS
jgi:hypothetical protein